VEILPTSSIQRPQENPTLPHTPTSLKEFSEPTPKNGEKVISKRLLGYFTGNGPASFLEGTGKGKAVSTEYMADVCVSATVSPSAEQGLEVIVAEVLLVTVTFLVPVWRIDQDNAR